MGGWIPHLPIPPVTIVAASRAPRPAPLPLRSPRFPLRSLPVVTPRAASQSTCRRLPASLAPGEVLYVCPMCPGVESPVPGACPRCGMALERAVPVATAGDDPELVDMRRRFGWAVVFTVPLMALAMGGMLGGVAACADRPDQRLAAVCAGHAGRPLVRRAAAAARLAVAALAQLQHVHADRARRRGGVRLQRAGSDVSRRSCRMLFAMASRRACTSNPPR